MPKDWLKGIDDYYDVVVVGSGLAGLTGANALAKAGHSVLLLEHHYQFGGLATWFKRAGGHIFDISLHGFPFGMIKSCRKYWTKEIAESIVQLKNIRFVNPQFDLGTTFDRWDFTRLLHDKFKVARERVEAFFEHLRKMYRKGFVSRLQLETQRENVEIANKSVRVAEIKLESLLKFTRAKSVAAFTADIAKQQAILTAAQRKLDLSRQKLADLTNQKANCRILAPKAGQVVYANDYERRENVVIEEGAEIRQRQVVLWLCCWGRSREVQEGHI